MDSGGFGEVRVRWKGEKRGEEATPRRRRTKVEVAVLEDLLALNLNGARHGRQSALSELRASGHLAREGVGEEVADLEGKRRGRGKRRHRQQGQQGDREEHAHDREMMTEHVAPSTHWKVDNCVFLISSWTRELGRCSWSNSRSSLQATTSTPRQSSGGI